LHLHEVRLAYSNVFQTYVFSASHASLFEYEFKISFDNLTIKIPSGAFTGDQKLELSETDPFPMDKEKPQKFLFLLN